MKKNILTLVGAAIFAFLPASQALAARTQTLRSQWQPQTISGKIATVDSGKKLVVIKDSSGTPFDFMVTSSTRIKQGTERLKLSDLASKSNDKVSVRYVPERKGDIAKLIEIAK